MKRFLIAVIFFIAVVFLCGCNGEADYELVSLDVNSRVSGSFFLGCGGVSEKIYYFAYVKVGDAIYPLYVYYGDVKIIMTTDKPRVHMTNLFSNAEFSQQRTSATKYTFYIPEGSIKNDFNMHLNK